MKNIKVSISPRLWGEEFAASAEKDKYTGVIDRWTDNKKDDLMILWEGYSRCQRAPLSKMDVDALGESLNFQLEPDEHGTRTCSTLMQAGPVPLMDVHAGTPKRGALQPPGRRLRRTEGRQRPHPPCAGLSLAKKEVRSLARPPSASYSN